MCALLPHVHTSMGRSRGATRRGDANENKILRNDFIRAHVQVCRAEREKWASAKQFRAQSSRYKEIEIDCDIHARHVMWN